MHANNLKSRQIDILENGTREQVIDWLAWNDANGVYTDEDSAAEGYEPLTLEQARELMRGQIED
ncbi:MULTISPECIES: hypothetical protein [unclassified Marinobacter]|uniref:hypothetical protein n=1 Tax=unclassified Marinobacter TaxID=83889 RepID=UPI0012689F12|nr:MULTISPECIES: hypothetical protein [unclassified Marinobacter]QFS86586.1 hypothetical protein FIV08_07040 [Marinobacter sp. THAF197a]QFT50370.1 hypothetical protein FIU96_06970 [Marinobacter sp. THAF39]QFT52892.1 hypothetical protein FIU96_19775 [Marinobacter sp. THAF39]